MPRTTDPDHITKKDKIFGHPSTTGSFATSTSANLSTESGLTGLDDSSLFLNFDKEDKRPKAERPYHQP